MARPRRLTTSLAEVDNSTGVETKQHHSEEEIQPVQVPRAPSALFPAPLCMAPPNANTVHPALKATLRHTRVGGIASTRTADAQGPTAVISLILLLLLLTAN
jgi:hypothetical protein